MKSALTVLVVSTWLLGAAAIAPAGAQTACGLRASCDVTSLGNDQYQITYVLINSSAGTDAIFKWRLGSPGVSSQWQAVQFNAPPGWTGAFTGGHLDFDTPNGSLGTLRINSANAVTHCGGVQSLTFSWVINRNGGPVPDCTTVHADEITVHVQAMNANNCENVGTSFLCTNIVPAEPVTWSSIKTRFLN